MTALVVRSWLGQRPQSAFALRLCDSIVGTSPDVDVLWVPFLIVPHEFALLRPRITTVSAPPARVGATNMHVRNRGLNCCVRHGVVCSIVRERLMRLIKLTDSQDGSL